jgi:hypothetical protein
LKFQNGVLKAARQSRRDPVAEHVPPEGRPRPGAPAGGRWSLRKMKRALLFLTLLLTGCTSFVYLDISNTTTSPVSVQIGSDTTHIAPGKVGQFKLTNSKGWIGQATTKIDGKTSTYSLPISATNIFMFVHHSNIKGRHAKCWIYEGGQLAIFMRSAGDRSETNIIIYPNERTLQHAPPAGRGEAPRP